MAVPPVFTRYTDSTVSGEAYGIEVVNRSDSRGDEEVVYRYRHNLLIWRKRKRFGVLVREKRKDLKKRYLEIGISISLMMILLDHGILTLHAAGAVINDTADIFIGTSGSGKTTISRILHREGCTIISDELVAVTRRGEEFRVFPAPRWGIHFFAPGFYHTDSWKGSLPLPKLGRMWVLKNHSRDGSRSRRITDCETAIHLIRAFFDSRFAHPLQREYKARAFLLATEMAASGGACSLELDLDHTGILLRTGNPIRYRKRDKALGKEYAMSVLGDSVLVLRFRDYHLLQVPAAEAGALRLLIENNGDIRRIMQDNKLKFPGSGGLLPEKLAGLWEALQGRSFR